MTALLEFEDDMAIEVAVENREELRFVVCRFSGHIAPSEAFAVLMRGVSQFPPHQPYRELLIFEHDTDLSDFDAKALTTIYQKSEEIHRALKLGPRTAATVLDGSIDAKMILPLFNALSSAGRGTDLSFALFSDIEPALKHLGVPLDQGLKIVARAA